MRSLWTIFEGTALRGQRGVKMTRFRLMCNKDAETEWINDMAAKGYAMTGFCAGFYFFDFCEPGKYEYQVDFSEGFFKVSQDYREFMAEAGVEIVCLWGPWVILRKEADEGAFELYTDVESTIEHYEKIRRMFKSAALLEALCLILQIPAAARGIWTGVAGMLALGAVFLAIVGEIRRINNILIGLYERIGREPDNIGLWGNRRISLLLPMGMLANVAALLMPEASHMSGGAFFYTVMHRVLQILALILMLAGIVRTWRARE